MSNIAKRIPINILHFRYTFKLGGVENVVLNIIKNTAKSENINHHVVIFHSEVADEFLINELKALGCKVYKLPIKETKNIFSLFEILKIIRQNNINIVNLHDAGGLKWLFMVKAFLPNLKSLFINHDTNFLHTLKKSEIFTLQNVVNKNIAISKAVEKEMNNYFIKNTKLIYNGIDVKNFKGDNQPIDFYSDCLKIVNIAWLRPHKKGQDLLIKALGLCKKNGIKFKCDLIGGISSEKDYEFLQQLVIDNDLKNEVNFIGVKKDIPALLKNYNLFSFPSRFEGFGLVMIEAMASGLPVIANSIDAPKELIVDDKNGFLFKTDDYEDLANRLCDLYNNREKLIAVSQKSSVFAENFDISIMVQNYNNLYRNLVEQNTYSKA